MKQFITYFIVVATALSLGSCRHKDISFENNDRVKVYVEFDWRNAPDANPTSMLTYFYPTVGSEEKLIYTFADRDGGEISLPYGNYSALAINGDNNYWASFRNTDGIDNFEVYTKDAEQLEGYGLATHNLPRAKGTESERLAKTPGMIWSDRSDGVELPEDFEGEKTITFYPDEKVCHYTVDVVDVKNLSNLHGAAIDATLSGMAEGYLHGKQTTTDVAVTMPFTLSPQSDSNSLHSEFLTFGECATIRVRHLLTLYMYLTDGSKWYQTFDVTDQVTQAPDPRHVHIIITGLNLPQPITGSGEGFKPDVNDWNDITIDLPM